MLNLRAQKRTALDNKTYWCAYDLDKHDWCSLYNACGKYTTRKAATSAIDRAVLESLDVGAVVKHSAMGRGVVAWKHGDEVGIDFAGSTWTGKIADMRKTGFTK